MPRWKRKNVSDTKMLNARKIFCNEIPQKNKTRFTSLSMPLPHIVMNRRSSFRLTIDRSPVRDENRSAHFWWFIVFICLFFIGHRELVEIKTTTTNVIWERSRSIYKQFNFTAFSLSSCARAHARILQEHFSYNCHSRSSCGFWKNVKIEVKRFWNHLLLAFDNEKWKL